MNTNMGEQISALMDGALDKSDANRLISHLKEDVETRETWTRYHLIREALRENLPDNLDHRVAQGVIAALANEPTVMAPRRVMVHNKLRKLTPVLKQISGLAVAASVTAVAILSVQTNSHNVGPDNPQVALNEPVASDYSQPAVAAAPAPTPAPAFPAKDNMLVAIPVQPMPAPQSLPDDYMQGTELQWDLGHPALESKLNHYLTNHTEYAIPADMQGMLPYGRIVGHESSKK